MEGKNKTAEEVYALQKALVHYTEAVGDKRHIEKTDRERCICELTNALLMQLHLFVDEEKLENEKSCTPLTPREQLADQLLKSSNVLRSSIAPIEQEVTNNFEEALGLLDLASAAKNGAKTALAKDKLKNLGE